MSITNVPEHGSPAVRGLTSPGSVLFHPTTLNLSVAFHTGVSSRRLRLVAHKSTDGFPDSIRYFKAKQHGLAAEGLGLYRALIGPRCRFVYPPFWFYCVPVLARPPIGEDSGCILVLVPPVARAQGDDTQRPSSNSKPTAAVAWSVMVSVAQVWLSPFCGRDKVTTKQANSATSLHNTIKAMLRACPSTTADETDDSRHKGNHSEQQALQLPVTPLPKINSACHTSTGRACCVTKGHHWPEDAALRHNGP
ncbi:hypothetical protein EGW08_001711 [Elysia chlorotica]|uniref:Uncharacterized protein n=1 Tax=Elysia chlorotica TaxID=188477 RepID=A0A3S1A4N7_ELYCH|nr:hypothetical protein EGW08_001711 [Elysia chlorotica]